MRSLLYGLAAAVIVGPEFAVWRSKGAKPSLWWRDDDARAPTPALAALIAAADARPLALAVVPAGEGLRALADRLAAPNLSIGQHGIDHVNRSKGPVNCEYPVEVGVDQMARAIGEGRARLVENGMTPLFYAPPWNAAQIALPEAISVLGYRVLSGGKVRIGQDAGLVYLSTDVDLIRWKEKPRFRGAYKVLSALRNAMRQRRRGGEMDRPIGLLTHHLDHDEQTWRFLAWFLTYADRRMAWTSVASLLKA